jgi:hypothetical protein
MYGEGNTKGMSTFLKKPLGAVWIGSCYGILPANLYVKYLISQNKIICGDRDFKENIKVKSGHWGRPNPI